MTEKRKLLPAKYAFANGAHAVQFRSIHTTTRRARADASAQCCRQAKKIRVAHSLASSFGGVLQEAPTAAPVITIE